MQPRKKTLIRAKVAFGVDRLLVEHESFCAGRRAEETIGLGVRWVVFTGNRRFSTVALERERLLQIDEPGRDGGGRVIWPPSQRRKGGREMLVPSEGPRGKIK